MRAPTKPCRAVRVATILTLAFLVSSCGRKSARDVVGPEPGPGPPAPVFEYVEMMIDDPWFSESLPGGLTQGSVLVPIRDALENGLRAAVEARSLPRLEAALGDLETGTALYRARPEFNPSDGPSLAAFELFAQQARAIRDGQVGWAPTPILRRDEG